MKMSLSASWLKKSIVIALIASTCIAPVIAMGITNIVQVSAIIALSPDSGYGHTIVTVSGSGFTKSESVVVDFAGMPVFSTMTRSDGSFVGQFVVPTDQNGTYTVSAVDKKGIKASTSFIVTSNPILTDIEKKLDQLLVRLSGEVPIGVLLPLNDPYGDASKAAIELAVKEVNKLLKEAGAPWTLKVLVKDTGWDPANALAKLEELYGEGVKFVIGPMSSKQVIEIMDYANDKKILVISQSSTGVWPELLEDDFIFRFCPSDSMQGRAIARLMYDTLTYRKVVAVYRNDMWGTGLLDAIETRFKVLTNGQGFAEKMPYDPEAPDFETLAADLNANVTAHGADGVLYIGFEEAMDFFTLAKEYPILGTVKWYGSEGTAPFESPHLIENATVAEFCAVTGFINTLFSPTKSDKYQKVHDELVAELGKEPHPCTYVAYDIVWALTYSLSLVDRYDSVAVRAVLPEVTESLFGASGWIVLNEAGDRATGDYDLWVIAKEAGEYKWKLVGTYIQATDSISWLLWKLAIAYDMSSGRGDMSWGSMAAMGADKAVKELGVELIELYSRTEADYVPNLITAAKDPDVQLIVGVGFLFSDALVEVARMFPDKNFAGIDTSSQSIVKDKYPDEYPLPNLMDIVNEEHKGSALVGALGALLAANYTKPYIGAVLGMDIPILWKFEIGYKWGCDWAINWTKENHPELEAGIVATPRNERVLWTYTGTFTDITKGYEAAKPMYEKDAVAVYNIAGPLGLGINQAVSEIAEDKGLESGPPFWIGVDADQDWINPGFVIASMMKRVDKSVYYATKLARGGLFRDIVKDTEGTLTLGIGTTVAGVLMEGISISTLEDLEAFIEMGIKAGTIKPEDRDIIYNKVKTMRDAQPAWIWGAVAELEEKIRYGEVEVPMVVTVEARDYWRGIFG